MEDKQIVDLYWQRSEEAIPATAAKYGAYCRTIANNILANNEDTEECVNDTWLKAWNSMPDNRPTLLGAYLGKLTRWLSLTKLRERGRLKRGGGEAEAALLELSLLASPDSPEREAESREFTAELNGFLEGLPPKKRRLFVQRYWYLMSTREIARDNTMTEAAVKMQLSRTRAELKAFLIRKGMFYE